MKLFNIDFLKQMGVPENVFKFMYFIFFRFLLQNDKINRKLNIILTDCVDMIGNLL